MLPSSNLNNAMIIITVARLLSSAGLWHRMDQSPATICHWDRYGWADEGHVKGMLCPRCQIDGGGGFVVVYLVLICDIRALDMHYLALPSAQQGGATALLPDSRSKNSHNLHPISLLTLSLPTLLDSNFTGNSLWAWEFHPLELRLCLSQTLWNPQC